MSTPGQSSTGRRRASEASTGPLRVRSVVGLAYDELRAMIVDGRLRPGARVGQAEIADALGISRGSVREALRRLAGDGLVVFEVNRGFFVADVGLEHVLERLEARLLLEPGIARLAAERRHEADLGALRRTVAAERAARTASAAHDASRRSASRTDPREMPSASAISAWPTRAPGRSLPSTIIARSSS